MPLIKLIKKFLRIKEMPKYTGPMLKTDYCVSDGTEQLATLRCVFPDQFWSKFELTPVTNNPDKLTLLYSFDFWLSNDIAITEQDTNRRVEFSLALLMSNDEEEFIDYLADRPQTIQLRGPYEFGFYKSIST